MSTDPLERALFRAGKGGYHTYRIPALAVTTHGTVLAFCEGRKHSSSDAGKIDIVLRRSHDHGLTWTEPEVIITDGDMTCGNPCPVVDAADGTIWLPFCKNLGEGHERLIIEGKAPRTVWLTRSPDDGATWATPREITTEVKPPNWTWYATGPGHGIQLRSGRLLIPCDHIEGVAFNQTDPGRSHVIYSDDHGATWQVGGVVAGDTDECEAVEMVDGQVYLNCRNHSSRHERVVTRSRDGGLTFDPPERDATLIEPVCQAGLVRFTHAARHRRNRILFSNPASAEKRERITVRLSYDECRTWPVARALHAGPAAYSDLAVAQDKTILCLYERGTSHPYETITCACFDLKWLEHGEQKP